MQRPSPTSGTPAGALPLWIVILCVGTIVAVSLGRAQSMGLYMPHVTQALGVGRESFGLAVALTQLLMGLGAPVSGALIDKHGAGRVVIVCTVLTVAGLWFMYSAASASDLIVGGILMGLGVAGTGMTSLIGTVGRHAPPDKRLAAMSSVGMAAGIGGLVALPVMHLLIEWLGWKNSLLALIGIVAASALVAIPISGKPVAPAGGPVKAQTLKAALAEAFTHPSYWLLTIGFFVCGFHVNFIVVHLPAFAMDKGLPSWVGPAALTLVGVANIIGTFIVGKTGKLIEKRKALSLIYALRAVVFLGFLYLPTTPVTVIGLSGALGLIWLATVPLTSGLVATFFGTAWMSMLFGIVFLSHQVGAFLGVWMAGLLFDQLHSYDAMWWISIGLGLLSAAINWPIREAPVPRPATA